MDCKYCDYLKELKTKSSDSSKNVFVCQFTNYMFTTDVETLDMEYPCKDVTYQDYLRAISKSSAAEKELTPAKECKQLERRAM